MTQTGKHPSWFRLRRVAGTNYLVDTREHGADYHRPLQINDMGAEIFEALVLGRTKAEMIQQLAEEYGVPDQTIEEDITSFLTQLKELNVME